MIYFSEGFRFRSEENGMKSLPHMTICAMAAFKQANLSFTAKEYLSNTFQLEDLFDNDTLKALKNSTRKVALILIFEF
jgi:hypothetical protein